MYVPSHHSCRIAGLVACLATLLSPALAHAAAPDCDGPSQDCVRVGHWNVSLAVGGEYEKYGQIERALVAFAGLRDGDRLIDLGCGSGRLAWALGQSMRVEYLGIDIVQALLD